MSNSEFVNEFSVDHHGLTNQEEALSIIDAKEDLLTTCDSIGVGPASGNQNNVTLNISDINEFPLIESASDMLASSVEIPLTTSTQLPVAIITNRDNYTRGLVGEQQTLLSSASSYYFQTEPIREENCDKLLNERGAEKTNIVVESVDSIGRFMDEDNHNTSKCDENLIIASEGMVDYEELILDERPSSTPQPTTEQINNVPLESYPNDFSKKNCNYFSPLVTIQKHETASNTKKFLLEESMQQPIDLDTEAIDFRNSLAVKPSIDVEEEQEIIEASQNTSMDSSHQILTFKLLNVDGSDSNANSKVESVINQKLESDLAIQKKTSASDDTLLCPVVHLNSLDSKHPTSKSKITVQKIYQIHTPSEHTNEEILKINYELNNTKMEKSKNKYSEDPEFLNYVDSLLDDKIKSESDPIEASTEIKSNQSNIDDNEMAMAEINYQVASTSAGLLKKRGPDESDDQFCYKKILPSKQKRRKTWSIEMEQSYSKSTKSRNSILSKSSASLQVKNATKKRKTTEQPATDSIVVYQSFDKSNPQNLRFRELKVIKTFHEITTYLICEDLEKRLQHRTKIEAKHIKKKLIGQKSFDRCLSKDDFLLKKGKLSIEATNELKALEPISQKKETSSAESTVDDGEQIKKRKTSMPKAKYFQVNKVSNTPKAVKDALTEKFKVITSRIRKESSSSSDIGSDIKQSEDTNFLNLSENTRRSSRLITNNSINKKKDLNNPSIVAIETVENASDKGAYDSNTSMNSTRTNKQELNSPTTANNNIKAKSTPPTLACRTPLINFADFKIKIVPGNKSKINQLDEPISDEKYSIESPKNSTQSRLAAVVTTVDPITKYCEKFSQMIDERTIQMDQYGLSSPVHMNHDYVQHEVTVCTNLEANYQSELDESLNRSATTVSSSKTIQNNPIVLIKRLEKDHVLKVTNQAKKNTLPQIKDCMVSLTRCDSKINVLLNNKKPKIQSFHAKIKKMANKKILKKQIGHLSTTVSSASKNKRFNMSYLYDDGVLPAKQEELIIIDSPFKDLPSNNMSVKQAGQNDPIKINVTINEKIFALNKNDGHYYPSILKSIQYIPHDKLYHYECAFLKSPENKSYANGDEEDDLIDELSSENVKVLSHELIKYDSLAKNDSIMVWSQKKKRYQESVLDNINLNKELVKLTNGKKNGIFYNVILQKTGNPKCASFNLVRLNETSFQKMYKRFQQLQAHVIDRPIETIKIDTREFNHFSETYSNKRTRPLSERSSLSPTN